MWPRLLARLFTRRHARSGGRWPRRFLPCPDWLPDRLMPACMAAFDPVNHFLSITGTTLNDICTVSTGAGGDILLDGNPTGATMTNTDTIDIFTDDGSDFILLDLTNGLFGPGFTAEASGQSEIEVRVHSGDDNQDTLFVKATLGNDVIDAGFTGGLPHVNLNGDDDVDLITNAVLEFSIYGQRGDDRISGAGTPVVGTIFQNALGLIGEDGNDTLTGGVGLFNTLDGGPGDDLMIGTITIDRYFFTGGGLGSDVIIDTNISGSDVLVFSNDLGNPSGIGAFIGPVDVDLSVLGPQVVNPGNLTLTLDVAGIDGVIGSAFDDYIVGDALTNVLLGGYPHLPTGNDFLIGQGGDDWLVGGDGSDVLRGNDGNDTMWGGGGPYATVPDGNDALLGGTGSDSMWGENGSDTLWGENGNDTLEGGNGTDSLLGGNGHDQQLGGNGQDTLKGGNGHDTMRGENGHDSMLGDNGNDLLGGGTGNDVLKGGNGNDFLAGDNGHDILLGDHGHDTLNGGNGNDWMSGGTGNDSLLGGAGNDSLLGEDGDDFLDGGPGTDFGDGGPGFDIVVNCNP